MNPRWTLFSSSALREMRSSLALRAGGSRDARRLIRQIDNEVRQRRIEEVAAEAQIVLTNKPQG